MSSVRKDIWMSAVEGLCAGTVLGYGGYAVAAFGHTRQYWTIPDSLVKNRKNVALASVLLGGAMGSFLASVTTGKNEVHRLHPIYNRSTIAPLPNLESDLPQQARMRETYLQRLERESDSIEQREAVDRLRRETNRLYRRASLNQSIQEHRGGLSDSHGGHWVQDMDDDQDEQGESHK
jgi:hypothetical protein